MDVSPLCELGGGTYGVVHLAEWRNDAMCARADGCKRFALKTLHAEKKTSFQVLFQAAREAAVAARPCHAIVRPFAVWRDATGTRLGSSALDKSLLDFLKHDTKRFLPQRFWVTACRDILHGLAALHAAGTVHLDLSPNNVLVELRDGDLRAAICDFGASKGPLETGVRRNQPCTLVSRAPELCGPDLGAHTTPAADVWAFGVLATTAWRYTNYNSFWFGHYGTVHESKPLAPAWHEFLLRNRVSQHLADVSVGLAYVIDASLSPDAARRPEARALCGSSVFRWDGIVPHPAPQAPAARKLAAPAATLTLRPSKHLAGGAHDGLLGVASDTPHAISDVAERRLVLKTAEAAAALLDPSPRDLATYFCVVDIFDRLTTPSLLKAFGWRHRLAIAASVAQVMTVPDDVSNVASRVVCEACGVVWEFKSELTWQALFTLEFDVTSARVNTAEALRAAGAWPWGADAARAALLTWPDGARSRARMVQDALRADA